MFHRHLSAFVRPNQVDVLRSREIMKPFMDQCRILNDKLIEDFEKDGVDPLHIIKEKITFERGKKMRYIENIMKCLSG